MRNGFCVVLQLQAMLLPAIAAVFLGVPVYAADKKALPSKSPFVGVRTTDTTPIPTQIGNYDYEIPANYFDTQPDSTCNWEAELLVALLPDFEGRSEASSWELDTAVGQDARRITILLEADRARRDRAQEDLESWTKIIERNNGPYEKAQYPWYKLDHWFYNGKTTKRHLSKDLFRSYENERLKTHIDCSIIGTVPSPGCSHNFAINDVKVKLHYPRSRLKDWQQIEATARKLIQSWVKGRAETRKPICDEFL